ncbi:hypothetical protein CRG98_022756 [Punica granatum]|uniref:Uncharacterized protein n=1 Tax=Punica granatum TaxID=22663 RepID=A0A2I0JKS1_PUNGR|nr:hypothetical protein CRG98_022756 [Punica granatum]
MSSVAASLKDSIANQHYVGAESSFMAEFPMVMSKITLKKSVDEQRECETIHILIPQRGESTKATINQAPSSTMKIKWSESFAFKGLPEDYFFKFDPIKRESMID